ncbi:PREDICTED: cytochrome b561 domain-containing protein 2 [Polistes canadensis]|uniref:cytochrome b561 domain-containing protein 2 n=1 Tax=Polistes canadensis TaxID=91411 RepID=UPI000718CC54|nr:PREDICTED: cytochrome b561 domain-containing protein 2 [Polistes canadensis]XP_014611079.1 PREDICTED: cytochrome b561 domain-containing protein 2 [Polistes canadensis]
MTASTSPTKTSPHPLAIAISVLTHLLLLTPVIYIVVLSVNTYNTFSWHPILTTVGIGLLMLEAIYCVSGEAYVSSKLTRKNRILIHWVLQSLGFVLTLAGVLVIIIMKGNRSHFTSVHGKLGLAAMILFAILMISGIFADNTKWFYPRIRPINIKIFHIVGGILVTLVLLAALINGTYTRWWPDTKLGRDLTFASFVIGTAFTMIKPTLGAVSKCKFMFRKSTTNT